MQRAAFWFAPILLLTMGAGPQAGVSVSDFRAADRNAKIKILADITAARSNMPIAAAIGLARAGLGDPAPDVRMAALGAVMGRAAAARWAGTPGPALGPRPGSPLPERPTIPVEWSGDQDALRSALEDDCLALLKTDRDDRVRYEALMAVANLERPLRADGPLPARLVTLFVDLYRHDPSARIRAEVVKTFRLVRNDTPDMRAVLRDALIDPSAAIRAEGVMGITPEATAAARRLSFEEARETLVAALAHVDPGIRLAAVRALNVFGAPAAPYIRTLEQLRDTDPDAQVRAAARLAIDAIQLALRRPS